MSKNQITYKVKAKAVICFCLVLIVNYLAAQNTGYYKYVLFRRYIGTWVSRCYYDKK